MQPFDLVEALRQQTMDSYAHAQEAAIADRNPWAYVGAKFGGLAAEVGYGFAATGRNLYQLATDTGAQANAAQQLAYLATHPMAPVVGAITDTVRFINKPFDEQADAVLKGGFGLLAGAGGAKAFNFAGDLAGKGAGAAYRWAEPAFENMATGYMQRSGMLLNAVPDGPSLLPSGLSGSASALSKNMGAGLSEGYQSHHLVLTSLAKDSSALRHLANEGLYDVNRASNGIRLPSNDFLALSNDLPLHRGFHGPEYRLAVRNQLDRLDAAYDAGLSNSQLLQRVSRIEQSLARDLVDGKLWLNSADAALRTIGPFGK